MAAQIILGSRSSDHLLAKRLKLPPINHCDAASKSLLLDVITWQQTKRVLPPPEEFNELPAFIKRRYYTLAMLALEDEIYPAFSFSLSEISKRVGANMRAWSDWRNELSQLGWLIPVYKPYVTSIPLYRIKTRQQEEVND